MYRFVGFVFFYHNDDTYIPKNLVLVDRVTEDRHLYTTANTESLPIEPRPNRGGGRGTRYIHPVQFSPGVAPEAILQLIGDRRIGVRGPQQLKVFEWMGIPAIDLVELFPQLSQEQAAPQEDQPPLFQTVVNGVQYVYVPVRL